MLCICAHVFTDVARVDGVDRGSITMDSDTQSCLNLSSCLAHEHRLTTRASHLRNFLVPNARDAARLSIQPLAQGAD